MLIQMTVYSKPACPQCDMTKRTLDAAGLPYTTIDLASDADALAMMTEKGFRQAPIVRAGDQWWSGFRPDLIKELNAVAA